MALVSLRVSGFRNPLQISASISVSRNSMITQRGPRVGVGDVGACALPQNYSSRILAPIQEGISILPWIECGGDAEPGIRPPECGSRFDVRFTDVSACPLSAMCGRLRVGKAFLHVCRLVGAAMCSACLCGSHDRWPQCLPRGLVFEFGGTSVRDCCGRMAVPD